MAVEDGETTADGRTAGKGYEISESPLWIAQTPSWLFFSDHPVLSYFCL